MIEQEDLKEATKIGKINNYYGGLYVAELNGKYYWSIENYSGFIWEKISEKLYKALLKHNKDTNA